MSMPYTQSFSPALFCTFCFASALNSKKTSENLFNWWSLSALKIKITIIKAVAGLLNCQIFFFEFVYFYESMIDWLFGSPLQGGNR